VDRLRAGRLDGGEDRLGVEVRLGRCAAPEGDGLVGHTHVERTGVDVGVDGHGADPEPLAGADDPDGDLPPVGHQQLRKEGVLGQCGVH
jgi:hypothetical protein